jgi:predicted Ser/Thr protein kinase
MTGSPPALAGLAEALDGRYRLERELGRGGMGVVYLARELRLERQVALKVLPPELARSPELRERFLREARTAAQLSHPNIVPIHHADETGGFAFFAMGFVDGETLADHIKSRGRLSPAETVRILREVAWALAYAHARGVIHRDIKPENVMLERATGRVLVTDFGIARDSRASSLTQEGHVLGSVHYMSPEQAVGDAIDGRSDLYALGVIGFQALSGQLPFSAAAAGAVLVMHATKPPPRLNEVAPDVPESLARVIDRALAKAPEDRYASGEALAAALGSAMEAAPVTPAGGIAIDQVLSAEQAQAVWLRAAQLQMEAASRIEARSRKELLPDTPAGGAPTSGYRLADVAAAAAEVGIGDEFVALALAELPGSSANAVAPVLSDREDRAATVALGSSQRSVSVSRVIRAAPARVLEALGRIAPGHPYDMRFMETQGGHPLDGGILLFELPRFLSGTLVSAKGISMFGYRMEQIELRRVQVRLHALAGDAGTEISIYGDLRPGVRANYRFSRWWTAGACAIGGGIGFAAAAQAGLAAAFLAAPLAGGVLAAGALGFVSYRYMFRDALKKATEELDGLLIAIDQDLRSLAIFSDRLA